MDHGANNGPPYCRGACPVTAPGASESRINIVDATFAGAIKRPLGGNAIAASVRLGPVACPVLTGPGAMAINLIPRSIAVTATKRSAVLPPPVRPARQNNDTKVSIGPGRWRHPHCRRSRDVPIDLGPHEARGMHDGIATPVRQRPRGRRYMPKARRNRAHGDGEDRAALRSRCPQRSISPPAAILHRPARCPISSPLPRQPAAE